MSDLKTIDCLREVCEFTYVMADDYCVEISFYSDEHPFGGTIRKSLNKSEIVSTVAQMPFLQKLNLRKCKVGRLPSFKSRSLDYIDLSGNDLEAVPDWVIEQQHLKFLNLGANKLQEVPTFDHLPLETLKLHKNSLTTEPVVNDRMKSLNLFLNPLPIFPEGVLKLHNLEVFTLGVTDIQELPPMSALSSLKWLTLTANQFKELPEDICEIKTLIGLQLAKNQLQSLPSQIGRLSNLRVLTVYQNQLTTLPDSLFELNISKLNLAGNHLEAYRDKTLHRFTDIAFLRI